MRALFGLFGRKRDEVRAQLRERAVALAETRQKWRSARADYNRCRAADDKRGMGEAAKRAKRFALEALRLEQSL